MARRVLIARLSRRRGPRSARLRLVRASSSPTDDPDHAGAVIFAERCAGCHTLDEAGTQGSALEGRRPRERRRAELQRPQGDRRATSSTRSATAASPARSCPRTSSTGEEARAGRRVPRRSTPGNGQADAASPALQRCRAGSQADPSRARRGARSAGPPRGRRRAAPGPASSRSTRAGARPRRRPRRCAPSRRRRPRRSPRASARARDVAADARAAEVAVGRGQGARRAGAHGARPSCRSSCARSPTCPTRRPPSPRTRCCGRRRRDQDRPRPPRPRRRRDRHGARRAHLGQPLRLPQGRRRRACSSRSCSSRSTSSRGARLRARRPARARARGGDVGHRLLPGRPSSRSTASPSRTRPVPRRHERGAARRAAHGRDPRRRRAAAALRRASRSCFRREAGSAGKDTRGIFRVHQFDKVEMFSFVEPDTSARRARLAARAIEEEIISALELPYRVVNIAAGDLGAPASKKYDIEAWLPGPAGATAS